MITQLDDMLLRHGPAMAAEVGRDDLWQRLFHEIEEGQLLVRQADLFHSFENSSRDLEQFVLPALLRSRDWERFIHYALVAANLRGLAESVADAEILPALVRSGSTDLAEGLAAELPGRLQRARFRAAIASVLDPAEPAYGRTLEGIASDLDETLPPEDRMAAEAWCETLEAVARPLAPALRRCWPGWTASLAAWNDLADRAWLAVAEGYLHGGLPRESELWEALSRLRDPSRAAGLVSSEVGRYALHGDLWEVLETLRGLPGMGATDFWAAAMALLAESTERGRPATELWQRAEGSYGPVPWSVPLLEIGCPLWVSFTSAERGSLAQRIAPPSCRAALHIVSLEALGRDEGAAESSLQDLPSGGAKLHWSLRYLAAHGELSRQELRSGVAAVARYLAAVRYGVPAEDLCRFLDLVAGAYPRDLRRQVENAFWSPAASSATLECLVDGARRSELLVELFTRAEAYAATVAGTEAEGFKLRARVLIRLSCRLCRARGDLQAFEGAARRLLPDEEDELRAALASELAEQGRHEEAERLCTGIVSRRERLLARLAIFQKREIPSGLLSAGALYEAVATVDSSEDERLALEALARVPFDLESLSQQYIERIGNRARRVDALVDLAYHGLLYQERTFPPGRRDHLAAVLPLKRSLGVVESEEWLLSLTPELVRLGGCLGPAAAAAELEEALVRVLELEAASWEDRSAAWQALVALIPSILGEDSSPQTAHANELARRAARLVRWIADLPLSMAPGAVRQALRDEWHRLFPQVLAVCQRMPHRFHRYLEHPVRAWLTFQGLRWLSPVVGEDRRWRGLAKLESWLLPRHLRPRWQTPWTEGRRETLRNRWDWISEEQWEILSPALSPAQRWLSEAERLRASASAPEERIETLAYALSTTYPERVPELLSLVPEGRRRDRLCLSLLRNQWLPPAIAPELLRLLSSLPLRWEGVARLGLKRDSEPGPPVAAISSLIAAARLDPGNPGTAALRRMLWRLASEERCLPSLAHGVLNALPAGGKEGAEWGLRLFLNAYLPPIPGEEAHPKTLERAAGVATAVGRALSLGGSYQGQGRSLSEDPPTGSPGPPPTSPVRGGSEHAAGSATRGDGNGGSKSAPSTALRAVPRRWQRLQFVKPLARTLLRRRARDNMSSFSLLVSMTWAIALMPFDAPLLPAVSQDSTSRSTTYGLWLLVPVFLVWILNSSVIGGLLAQDAPGAARLLPSLRRLLATLAGLPLAGLLAIPAWQGFIGWRRRRESLPAAPGFPGVGTRSSFAGRLPPWIPQPLLWGLRWMQSMPGFGSLLVINFGALILLATFLPSPSHPGSGVIAFALYRLLGCSAMLAHIVAGREEGQLPSELRALRLGVALVWLLPLPGAGFLSLLFYVLLGVLTPSRRESTLTRGAWAKWQQVSRLPRWRTLVESLSVGTPVRGLWERLKRPSHLASAPLEVGFIERRLRLLLYGKLSLLFLEAGVVSRLVVTVVAWTVPTALERSGDILEIISLISLAIAAIAVLSMAARALHHILFKHERHGPDAGVLSPLPVLAGSQLAFAGGLLFGQAIAQGDPTRVGDTLAMVGVAGAAFQFVQLMSHESQEGERFRTTALLGFASMGLCGLDLSRSTTGPQVISLLITFLLPWTLLGPPMGARGLRWLLHPSALATASGNRPRIRRRWCHHALITSAVIPLGSLASPLWHYLRRGGT